jgi:peptidoglycan/LPS O-acetylase OafA/YrhL
MPLSNLIDGHHNNFTPLRILCAIAVLFGHSWDLLLGVPNLDPFSYFLLPSLGQSLPALAVHVFFIISGFLVCQSYCNRNNLILFMRARFFRIYPGLVVAVLFSILLGAAVTTLSLDEYFYSKALWDYFKFNSMLINGLNFELPGVFAKNPYPSVVNGSLWSLPYEVWLYVSLAILGSLQVINGRATYNLFLILVSLVYLQQTPENILFLKEKMHVELAFFFMLGSFLYINRDLVDISFKSLLILLAIYYSLQFIFLAHEIHFFTYMKCICISYLVILIAYHPVLRIKSLDNIPDVSYGIYIYAFPIQQLIAYLLPQIQPWSMFFIASLVTMPIAYLSYIFIETPFIKLNSKLH